LCAFSIRARMPVANVMVYTDQPRLFAEHGFATHALEPLELVFMRGVLDFPHRIKIEVLLDASLRWSHESPLTYVDGDMYLQQPATESRHTSLVMHKFEGEIGSSFHARLNSFLIKNAEAISKSPYRGMQSGMKMYNAGLIGLPCSPDVPLFLLQVRRMTDWLCVKFPEQIGWQEQTAFSFLGQNTYGIEADTMGFEHYWGCNTEVAEVLQRTPVDQIKLIGSDSARFDDLLAEAKSLSERPSHKWKLRKAKWKRSCKKRTVARRARSLDKTA